MKKNVWQAWIVKLSLLCASCKVLPSNCQESIENRTLWDTSLFISRFPFGNSTLSGSRVISRSRQH
ncbi:unnamed protein product [Schistosoma bovis]|nr:unnamed protein product [Schistosoma bovis]